MAEEDISEYFVEASIRVHKHSLSSPECRQLLLECDNELGLRNPFDVVTRLDSIARSLRTADCIWTMAGLF